MLLHDCIINIKANLCNPGCKEFYVNNLPDLCLAKHMLSLANVRKTSTAFGHHQGVMVDGYHLQQITIFLSILCNNLDNFIHKFDCSKVLLGRALLTFLTRHLTRLAMGTLPTLMDMEVNLQHTLPSLSLVSTLDVLGLRWVYPLSKAAHQVRL